MADIIQIKGLAELNQRLLALPQLMQTKVLRGAMLAGAKVVRDTAKANAPLGPGPKRRYNGNITPPGVLKRSALVKFDKSNSNGTQVVYLATFRKGRKQQKANRDAFYASWVEFGHKIVPRKSKSGKGIALRRRGATGRVPPHKFLTPAFNSTQSQVLQVIENKIRAGVNTL